MALRATSGLARLAVVACLAVAGVTTACSSGTTPDCSDAQCGTFTVIPDATVDGPVEAVAPDSSDDASDDAFEEGSTPLDATGTDAQGDASIEDGDAHAQARMRHAQTTAVSSMPRRRPWRPPTRLSSVDISDHAGTISSGLMRARAARRESDLPASRVAAAVVTAALCRVPRRRLRRRAGVAG